MGRSPSRRQRSRSRSRERPRRGAAERSGRGRPAASPERAGRSRLPVSPDRGGRSRPAGSPERGRARQASPPPRDRSRERRRHRHDRESSAEASVAPKARSKALPERPAITQADLEGKSPEEQEMIRVMGFGGFDSTKGKKVENNEAGEVQVVLKRKYRQYMNRKGGFNRPLDFVA